ncbi:MAG: hypothetical protein ACK40S_04020 [Burkholderiaceae bacterium]
MQPQHCARQLLLLGIGQAVGFVGGALLGRWVGTLLGWDAFGPNGYDGPAMLGIALIGLGGGGGVHLARRLYIHRFGDPKV